MKTKTSFSAKLLNRPATLSGFLMAAALMAPVAALSLPLEKIKLGLTAKFVVLAGSLVSNVPGSDITGDVGLSPSAGSMITGFGSSEVTGTIYTVDVSGPAGSVAAASELTTAKGDLTIAYNDAAGRTPVPSGTFLDPGAGNIGGMTLVPGLYKFTSTLAITGFDVHLSGGADDVWIFQVASNLNVGNGIKVILEGGAQAANVFWQIGTSATLGTTSVFKGTIMADQSISMNTGASLEGRALASIAAVTLASSTVTRPVLAGTAVNAPSNATYGLFLSGMVNRSDRTAVIGFTVPFSGRTTLTVLDAGGREVATLFNGRTIAGQSNQVQFSTAGLSKGLLFSKLEFDGKVHVMKLLLVD